MSQQPSQPPSPPTQTTAATQTISEYLDHSISLLNGLRDREESLSPTKKRGFENRFSRIHQLAVQKGLASREMFLPKDTQASAPERNHISDSDDDRTRNSDDEEEDLDGGGEQEDQDAQKQKTKEEIDAIRFITFQSKQGSRPLFPAELKDLWTEARTGKLQKQELDAVQRLLSGVQPTEPEEWTALFREICALEKPIDIQQQIDTYEQCAKESNLQKRLLKRELAFHHTDIRNIAHRLIENIFVKTETIRFAMDYNQLSPQEKTRWAETAFVGTHGSLFEGLSTEDAKKKALEREHKAEFVLWKRAFIQPATTARNRLLQLFNEYGSMVILDPSWNLINLRTNHAGRTHKLLMALPAKLHAVRMPNGELAPHPLGALQESVDDTLKNVVHLIAGEEASEFVEDFLLEMAPLSEIVRWSPEDDNENSA